MGSAPDAENGPDERPAVARAGQRDLRQELVRASDAILAERGLEGFSLREAARRAGVSAAAPAHHFGSAAGLLTEVAAIGYRELTRYIAVDPSHGTPAERLRAQGVGYVRFALAYPGRFHLMFRHDLLLPDHSALDAASKAAWDALAASVRAYHGLPADHPVDPALRATILGVWSTVHGFAHLALDGKFARLEPDADTDHLLNTLLPQVLQALWPDPPAA